MLAFVWVHRDGCTTRVYIPRRFIHCVGLCGYIVMAILRMLLESSFSVGLYDRCTMYAFSLGVIQCVCVSVCMWPVLAPLAMHARETECWCWLLDVFVLGGAVCVG